MPKLLNLLAFAVGASIAMSGLAVVTPAPAQADEAARQLERPKKRFTKAGCLKRDSLPGVSECSPAVAPALAGAF